MISTSHFHPMLVHFPIALVTLGFLAEFIYQFIKKDQSFASISFFLLITGTLSALFAWLSGLLFTSEMSGSADEIQDIHELFAWITLGLLLVTSVLSIIKLVKKTDNLILKWLVFSLYAFAMVSVSITGYFGGTLVYNYMMPL